MRQSFVPGLGTRNAEQGLTLGLATRLNFPSDSSVFNNRQLGGVFDSDFPRGLREASQFALEVQAWSEWREGGGFGEQYRV